MSMVYRLTGNGWGGIIQTDNICLKAWREKVYTIHVNQLIRARPYFKVIFTVAGTAALHSGEGDCFLLNDYILGLFKTCLWMSVCAVWLQCALKEWSYAFILVCSLSWWQQTDPGSSAPKNHWLLHTTYRNIADVLNSAGEIANTIYLQHKTHPRVQWAKGTPFQITSSISLSITVYI